MQLVKQTLKHELYTTSEVIAEYTGIQKKNVHELIKTHEETLKQFGKIAFETEALESGQTKTNYLLNEQQATLLITFMKNTQAVVVFKTKLVQAFFDLRNQVAEFKLHRALEKPKRKQLTDSIQKWPHASKWSYKTLTDLLLKHVTGKTAKQLKRGASCTALDLLTGKQLERYQALEQLVISLVELNYTYNEIKAILQKGE